MKIIIIRTQAGSDKNFADLQAMEGWVVVNFEVYSS